MNYDRYHYEAKTFADASKIAEKLAGYFPDYNAAYYGLSELIMNGIEHGNLGIAYEEKIALLRDDRWLAEIERRLHLPENLNKKVDVQFEQTDSSILVRIMDMGKGFNWKEFITLSPERAEQPAGRGIATTIGLEFAEVKYLSTGNVVECLLIKSA